MATRRQGLVEVTRDIADWLAAQRIDDGLLTIFCRHTSASLTINENAAPAVRRDLERYFNTLAPESRAYEHDDEGPDDMPAHLKTALTQVSLSMKGTDGFVLEGSSDVGKISRDPQDLVNQMIGRHHQYPDGAVLFLGTMFAPVKDRDAKGVGFTHHVGDVVTIAAPKLGALTNVVTTSDQAPEWNFGVGDLMRNLAKRGLL